LLDTYDTIPHSPDIADFGQTGMTESRQYFLLDENTTSPCLYSTLEKAEKADYFS